MNCHPHLAKLRLFAATIVSAILISAAPESTLSQTLSNFDRDRGILMLQQVRNQLKKSYYDPTFKGMNVDARFKEAEGKIKEATSLGQIFGIIAQVLLELKDSHTTFGPPQRTYRTDYGWQMGMVGDRCFVLAVKPGSDAEKKGLKVGHQVYSVNGYGPIRENLSTLQYLLYRLRPVPGIQVVVIDKGQPKQMDIMAKVTQGKQVMDLTDSDGGDYWQLVREEENEGRLFAHRYYEDLSDVMIWKMPHFDLDDEGVDKMMDKARKRSALILDLRGNPGGSVNTLKRMVGALFETEIKIADEKGRKESKPMVSKTRKNDAFKGKLFVLVDASSGSSAEVFARIVQINKRGTVIGDRTAGAVMVSRNFPFQIGTDTIVPFSASITVADLIMSDGKSLEGVGVIPDELLLPTGDDLMGKRDPVLARAAALAGLKLAPEAAATMFPIEWKK